MNAQDSNAITRAYLDSIQVGQRLFGSDLADTETKILGNVFATPIMNAAFSHVQRLRPESPCASAEMSEGFRKAGALNLWGMCNDDEFEKIAQKAPDTIRIIKPYEDEKKIFAQIECAKRAGVFGVGMDIDHIYQRSGAYDVVLGEEMRPKTIEQIHSYIEAAEGLPFVIKGVLSPYDAEASVKAGASAIIVSTHHGIMESMVPPLRVLPDIVSAVHGAVEIYVDGHMDSGMDAFKALALGADAVSVSRHILDCLHDGGAEGVQKRVEEMTGELRFIMSRCGFRKTGDIDASVLYM